MNKILEENIVDKKGKIIAEENALITEKNIDAILAILKETNKTSLDTRPFVT